MNLLLDTHVVLWWLSDAMELGPEARVAIADPGNVVRVSSASVWEIALKKALGKLEIPDDWFEALAEEPFQRLSIVWEHTRQGSLLPPYHRDPFDRMLVAQAITEGLTLVTRDRVIARYPVQVLLV